MARCLCHNRHDAILLDRLPDSCHFKTWPLSTATLRLRLKKEDWPYFLQSLAQWDLSTTRQPNRADWKLRKLGPVSPFHRLTETRLPDSVILLPSGANSKHCNVLTSWVAAALSTEPPLTNGCFRISLVCLKPSTCPLSLRLKETGRARKRHLWFLILHAKVKINDSSCRIGTSNITFSLY